MNHGVAILKEDWDIFKKGDAFVVSGCIQDVGVSLYTAGQRGCTVPFIQWASREDCEKFFELHIYAEQEEPKWYAIIDDVGVTFYKHMGSKNNLYQEMNDEDS